ncbi:MAG: condensation domain-containing protein [Burkholderiaceae bacterium]|nr:condensation domain-containing protein [Burkholderiaceae bacterium]
MARDLGLLYDALRDGRTLAPLPLQFGDYAHWQEERIDEGALAGSIEYWKRQLSGVEPLRLGQGWTGALDSHRQAEPVTFQVPRELAERLGTLAHTESGTLYMVLLAAFRVLLGRYSGQFTFTIGSPVAGRDRPELEDLVGYFVNMLVMRANLSGDPPFLEHFHRVRATALEAYQHRDVPFDLLVEHLNPDRQAGRNPLFDVSFALQNVPRHELRLGTTIAPLQSLSAGSAKFDLDLTISEFSAGLEARFDYDPGLFDRAMIERMAGHFRNLLESIVAEPAAGVSALPMMDQSELQQILVQWNDTARKYPAHATLHQLFEQQAERTPRATAVVFDDQRLDYDALNCRANQLAHRLRRLGVGPDVLVGLHMQRSPAMIVAMLAILKAGGAYVPIDVDYPVERVAFMLADSNAPVTVTQKSLASRAAAASSMTLCPGDDPTLDEEPRDNLPPWHTPSTSPM